MDSESAAMTTAAPPEKMMLDAARDLEIDAGALTTIYPAVQGDI